MNGLARLQALAGRPATVRSDLIEDLREEMTVALDWGTALAFRSVMRNTAILAVAFCSFACAAAPAFAQRTPAPGMWAVGGSAGASLPTHPSLTKRLDVAARLEGYLTSRVPVRGQIGGSWCDIVGRKFTVTVTPLRLHG